MSPLNNAWDLLKGKTYRDQRGTLGYGLEGAKTRAGEQSQPFTNLNVRQRVPLVGADRIDEAYAERGDKPQMNRRGAEQDAFKRNLPRDAAPIPSMGVPTEERTKPSMYQMLFGQSKPRSMELADFDPALRDFVDSQDDIVETGHPMELAFRLLKENYSTGDTEINPLDAALARARNQPPAPTANIQGSRMARQPPKTMQELLAMLEDKQGSPPMGQMPPPPQ